MWAETACMKCFTWNVNWYHIPISSLSNNLHITIQGLFQPLTCGDRIILVKHSQYHACWCPANARSQGISTHDVDYVELVSSCLTKKISTTPVTSVWRNDVSCTYIFMFPKNNSARKGLAYTFIHVSMGDCKITHNISNTADAMAYSQYYAVSWSLSIVWPAHGEAVCWYGYRLLIRYDDVEHYDVINWKHLYGANISFDALVIFSPNKLLNKQSRDRRFQIF